MSEIKKYGSINLGSADNGITVSFSIIKESEDNTFEPRMHHHKEFVFENDNIDKAFELMRGLVDYNMKKKIEKTYILTLSVQTYKILIFNCFKFFSSNCFEIWF